MISFKDEHPEKVFDKIDLIGDEIEIFLNLLFSINKQLGIALMFALKSIDSTSSKLLFPIEYTEEGIQKFF